MTMVAFPAPELHEPIVDAVRDALRERVEANEIELASLTIDVIRSICLAGYFIGKA